MQNCSIRSDLLSQSLRCNKHPCGAYSRRSFLMKVFGFLFFLSLSLILSNSIMIYLGVFILLSLLLEVYWISWVKTFGKISTIISSNIFSISLFLLLILVFSFSCAKAGHPLGGLQAPNSFLILWSLLSENGKMPSGPSSFEMAEKFREFSAPLPSRRSLYLGQSQMGMCFKLPNPLAGVRCDHFRQAGLCHGKPRGPKLENWFLFLVSDVPTTPSPDSQWSGLCTFFWSAGECNPQSGRAQAASGNSVNDF